MPEFQGLKISRAEELARHRFRRELRRALRLEARSRGWKTIDGVLYREHVGWLVQIWHLVLIFLRETEASLKIKPVGCDPIFWDILGMPENNRQPLSFRVLGAWTCRPVEYSRSAIDEGEMDAGTAARRLVDWADKAFEAALADLTTDRFLERLRASPEQMKKNRLVATLATTLLMAGRDDEAEQACVAALEHGSSGGFFDAAGTFPQVALDYIRAQRNSSPAH